MINGDLLPNGMRRAAQGVSHEREKGEEGGEKKSLSLSRTLVRSLSLNTEAGRCGALVIERGGPRAYVPAHRGMRATHSRSKRDQARRAGEGEGRCVSGNEISRFRRTEGDTRNRGGSAPCVSLAFRHENRNGRINSGYTCAPHTRPSRLSKRQSTTGIFWGFHRQRGAAISRYPALGIFYLVHGPRSRTACRWPATSAGSVIKSEANETR